MNQKQNTFQGIDLSMHWSPPQGSDEESTGSQPYDSQVDARENLALPCNGSDEDAFSTLSEASETCSVACHLFLLPPRNVSQVSSEPSEANEMTGHPDALAWVKDASTMHYLITQYVPIGTTDVKLMKRPRYDLPS